MSINDAIYPDLDLVGHIIAVACRRKHPSQ